MVIRFGKIHLLSGLVLFCGVLLLFAIHADPTKQALSPVQSRTLPVVMYHHVLRDPRRAGKYVLPEETLREDLAYLQQCGYTSVTVGDVLAFVKGKKELPEKIVMLTFDDGYQSMETYVLPLLQAYRMKAVLSVVGQFAQSYTDSGDTNVGYACLSWDALRRLSDSGCFELQNHTYDLHKNGAAGRKGLAQKRGESLDAYRTMLTEDLMKNQNAIRQFTGQTPAALTYPFGACSDSTPQIAKECGFQAILTCAQTVNTITQGDAESLFALGRFNRAAGEDSAAFFQKLGISQANSGT